MTLDAPHKEPNDLSLQRWGVIYADTDAGKRAFEAVAPLIQWRAQEQGANVLSFAVPAEMDLLDSVEWKNKNLLNNDLPEPERPRYLLILGDLDEVSAELGHVLANGSFVGRIHFDQAAGYEAYAQKLKTCEQSPSAFDKAAAKFFAASDGTRATAQGRRYVINECLDWSRRPNYVPFAMDVEDPWGDIKTAQDFLAKCSIEQPSVLLSVCHGLRGTEKNPWKSVVEQRQFQGSMTVGSSPNEDAMLRAEDVRDKRFLPGGLWFTMACFGAGTPSQGAFYPWLRQLADAKQYQESVQTVLESLPADGQKPFIAALPKAALANPNGPLAMIAHLDLAWTYGFIDQNKKSRASRIFSAFSKMAEGSRVGVALDAIMRAYREVNDDLVSDYQNEEYARVMKRVYQVNSAQRAYAFMVRNDLRGYVLLGDPAARLPLAKNKAVIAPKPTIPQRDPVQMQTAVLAVLGRESSMGTIAKRYNVSKEELDTWVNTYKAGGLAALRGASGKIT